MLDPRERELQNERFHISGGFLPGGWGGVGGWVVGYSRGGGFGGGGGGKAGLGMKKCLRPGYGLR